MATGEQSPHCYCDFNRLFSKSVPHILEKIFFSLDFDSFVACGKVTLAWEELHSSRLYQEKAYELWREKEENEIRLFKASRNGDVEEVQRLLESGINPNVKRAVFPINSLCQNALCIAASNGNIEVVKLLLKFGADPNIQSSLGLTPLHAARRGKNELVKQLINAGALPNIVDINGDTPLHLAVLAGSLNVVEVLLDAGADPKMTNRQGQTPFSYLAKYYSDDIITKIMKDRYVRFLSD